MATSEQDHNAEIWKSEEVVRNWVASVGAREARREAQFRLMGELLPYQQDEAFSFLDVGAGTGSAARMILEMYPASTAYLAEFSPQMIEQGTQALASYAGRFNYVEFDLVEGEWPSAIPDGLGAAISSQSVHHIPDEAKARLFRSLAEHLAPGGWYLNFDPVVAPDELIEQNWARANARQDPEAAEKALHRDAEEQRRHENHVRYMIPLAPQLQMLADAGFEAIDVYWKHLDYVIFGGRRPQ